MISSVPNFSCLASIFINCSCQNKAQKYLHSHHFVILCFKKEYYLIKSCSIIQSYYHTLTSYHGLNIFGTTLAVVLRLASAMLLRLI